jgi:hypothetical protein
VFVIGDKEVLGGDPAFPQKMKAYWTLFVSQDKAQQLPGIMPADNKLSERVGTSSSITGIQPNEDGLIENTDS